MEGPLVNIGAKVPVEMKERLEAVALDRSEPGNRVTTSEVLREAVELYFETELEGGSDE